MFKSFGGNVNSSGLDNALATVGGNKLVEVDYYWSSTEWPSYNSDRAYYASITSWGGVLWDTEDKNAEGYCFVRACLAF